MEASYKPYVSIQGHLCTVQLFHVSEYSGKPHHATANFVLLLSYLVPTPLV